MSGDSLNGNANKCLKFVSSLNEKFSMPDGAPKCTWHKKIDPTQSPHSKAEWKREKKILDNVIEACGNTPLVKLSKIPKSYGVECDVYVKCEFFNPGGSIKDRIGFRMIEDAEKCGLLSPGATIIEPTSGNTGIGLALGAAIKGYRCVIVMSEKMSNEKVDVLRALGAEIVRTPLQADSNSPDGLFAVSHRLKKQIPNSIILDQYSNPGNPLAHYDTTAEEILDQCDGKVDVIVVGTGTGGSITGIGKKIKEKSPQTVIVGADPLGSSLAIPESLNKTDVEFYEVEGVGYDFIPTGFDRSIVDKWVKTNDTESLVMARRLIREEGLLCGGSSGANVAAAMKVATSLKKGQRMVVILPDSIRNYLTKFVSDPWMEARGFKECENVNNHWWWDEVVSSLIDSSRPLVTATTSTTCDALFKLMKKCNLNEIAVVEQNGALKSVVTMQKLLNAISQGVSQLGDGIERAFSPVYPKISTERNLGLLSRILERESYVVVVENQATNNGVIEKPLGILSALDLLQYISTNGK